MAVVVAAVLRHGLVGVGRADWWEAVLGVKVPGLYECMRERPGRRGGQAGYCRSGSVIYTEVLQLRRGANGGVCIRWVAARKAVLESDMVAVRIVRLLFRSRRGR